MSSVVFLFLDHNFSLTKFFFDRHHWNVISQPAVKTEKSTSNEGSDGTATVTNGPSPSTSKPQGKTKQTNILDYTKPPYAKDSPRYTSISKAIAEHIITDLRPISTVEAPGFRNLLRTLDYRYEPPCANYIKDRHIVPIYNTTKGKVMEDIKRGCAHAITTDGWSSLAAENYITSTCHFIDPVEFEIRNYVLDTKKSFVDHTGENLADEMIGVVTNWGLKHPSILRDNAANMVKAGELVPYPDIDCIAHCLNRTASRVMDIPEVKALVGKSRKLVTAFKKSPKKTLALHRAEEDLEMKVNQYIPMA